MTVLVTGGAGFIGAAVVSSLIESGEQVVCVDNFNDYYNPGLKRKRIELLGKKTNLKVIEIDIAETAAVNELINSVKPKKVIHLAAQAGIRQASIDPHSYGRTNLFGFLNVIEASAKSGVENFVFASTSSVYG